ncbi:MAG: RNA polymerase sigma factor [Prevotella sp.]|nr:RNA polymerase sigma factor [Prevotella sp.]
MKLFTLRNKANDNTLTLQAERSRLLQYARYRLGSDDEAEDIVQDAWLSLCQKQSEGFAPANVSAYLFRAVSNLCVSRQREAARWRQVPYETQSHLPAAETENFEEEFQRIRRLLSLIPDEQAEVIQLRYYGDKSFREIADILDIPLSTAKSRFVYGMDKIRQSFTSLNR